MPAENVILWNGLRLNRFLAEVSIVSLGLFPAGKKRAMQVKDMLARHCLAYISSRHVHIRLAKLSFRPGALLLKTQNSAPIYLNIAIAALGSFKARIRLTLAVTNATYSTQKIKKPNQQR